MHAQKSVATVFMFARTTKRFKNTKNFAITSKLVTFCYLSRTATVSLSKIFKQNSSSTGCLFWPRVNHCSGIISWTKHTDFRVSCVGQTHSERLLLCSHFTWKSKFGVLPSVQRWRLHASLCEANGDTGKRYLREKAKTQVLHGSSWTSKRACDSLLDMWN